VSREFPEVLETGGDVVTVSGPNTALERICGTCSRSPAAMVEMLPGRHGPPGVWWLCGTCYGTPGERVVAPVRFGRGRTPRAPARTGELLRGPHQGSPRAESSGAEGPLSGEAKGEKTPHGASQSDLRGVE
jgi:hypothetical protein